MIFVALLACSHDKALKLDTGWPPPAEEEPTYDPGPEDHAYTEYEGLTRYQSAWLPDADARSCDLYWDTVGTPRDLCDGCIWAFDLELTYDDTRSTDEIDCLAELERDWSWSIGLSPTYQAYDVPTLWYFVQDYRYWYPMFVASWDYPDVIWGGGSYENPHDLDGVTYYYTDYWYGTATVR